MYIYKITTTVEIPEEPPMIFTTSSEGETKVPGNTIYALLKGHIALLQTELEQLEKVIK